MSNKKSSETIVQGRRLRPIYDAIDSGQNKKAIQEAEKVLKKHPDTLAAKALKALALIRSERSAEAWVIIGDVEEGIKTGSYDENLVQAVCHCYKEGFMPERIVALYEMLTKQFPSDEAMLSQLFLAYVRVRNYREQQKLAMQLYKEFNLPPYFMWSIMSIVMQGLENETMGSSMFYPLAEKMLNKISESYTLKGEEVDMYLIVLEARGKLKEAIDFLNNDQSYNEANVVPGTKAYHALDRLHFLAGDYNVVIERALKNIEKDCNDWSSWLHFLDSQFEVANSLAAQAKNSKQSDVVVKQLSDAVEVCLQAVEKSKNLPELALRRGPVLACLEAHNRLKKYEYFPNKKLENELKLDSALSYLKRIIDCSHTKPYCFFDFKLYYHLLDETSEERLISYIDELIVAGEKSGSADNLLWTNVLKEKILLTQVRRRNVKLSIAELNERLRRIFAKLPSNPQHGQVASAYAGIFVGYLFKLDNSIDLPDAFMLILVLEYIKHEYANCDTTVSILLCRLYSLFGDVSQVQELCRQLEIKYIQRDSLGYLQFFLAERFGRFNSAVIFYTSFSVQCDQNEREISECCVNAYRNGQFAQISKLADFHRRCVNSVYSVASDVFNVSFSSCFAVESLEIAGETLLGDSTKIDWNNLHDNRDFSVISSMTSDCCTDDLPSYKTKTFDEMVCILKLHHSLCRLIGLLSSNSVTSRAFEAQLIEFTSSLNDCEQKCDIFEQDQPYLLQYYLHLRLPRLIRGGYLKAPLFVLRAAQLIIDGNAENVVIEKLPSTEELSLIVKAITPDDNGNSAKEESIVCLLECIENCSLVVHYLLLSIIALKFLDRIVVAVNTVKGEKNTKTNDKLKESPILECISSYQSIILNSLNSVRKLLISKLDCEAQKSNLKLINKVADLQFPSVNFSWLNIENASNGEENVIKKLATLRQNVENSINLSFAESIRQILGALAHADEKLLGNALSRV